MDNLKLLYFWHRDLAPVESFDYIVYTDGGYSVSDNIGAGAYIILESDGKTLVRQESFVLRNETSQRVELKAILAALKALPGGSKVQICTDNQYASTGLGKIPRRKNKPDMDLLLQYKRMVDHKHLKVDFKWVRGHIGDPWNELCDSLCTEALAAES